MDLGMENGGKLMERMDLHVENIKPRTITLGVWSTTTVSGSLGTVVDAGYITKGIKLRKSDSLCLPRHYDSYGYILIQRVLSDVVGYVQGMNPLNWSWFSRGIFEPQLQLQISRFLVATCLGINPKKNVTVFYVPWHRTPWYVHISPVKSSSLFLNHVNSQFQPTSSSSLHPLNPLPAESPIHPPEESYIPTRIQPPYLTHLLGI